MRGGVNTVDSPMAEILKCFFKSVLNMKNKEKKFGQLGSEEDPVITITKEQVRDYFGTPECIQTSLLRLQGDWPADTPAQNC